MKLPKNSLLFQDKPWRIAAIIFLFVAALGIRVYDLNNPPFDFHPTRQFFTAIVARGEYYQNLTTAPQWMVDRAVGHWKAEETEFPTIDLLAAWTYRLIGHEELFFPRLYSAIFWLIGGLAVFFLARDLVSMDGAMVALAFYLFAPYAVTASRSFQPDPLMVCLILFAWWSMHRWMTTGKWKWAILAGVLSGAAMLVKVLAAFSLLGGMVGIFIAPGIRKSIRNIRFWVMGIIAAVPMLIWMIYGLFVSGSLSGQFSLRFFPNLWISPLYYLRLEFMAEQVVGLVPLLLALIGFFLLVGKEKRIFVAGLWGGYVAFALAFAYFFMTHDYYHITLVPIVALSLAPLAELIFRRLEALNPGWLVRAGISLVLLFGFSANLWNIRQTFHKADYRPQAEMLTHIGQVLGPDVSVIALTSDYGYPLFYFSWISASYWPYTGDTALRQMAGMDIPAFAEQFQQMTAEKQYFVVTDLAELDNQPDLKNFLAATYPVYDKGDGYIIYDLLHPNAAP
jgi:4-amino-4-deoxy-L-arabinose transferase-like glycosyltransferase